MAEAQEAPYFRAILATLARGSGASAIAFLIDEFEEIGLQKRLTKRAAHDYLSTLKRLINLAQDEDNPFWVFLSMTPDAHRTTLKLEPGVIERFAEHTNVLQLDALGQDEAANLVRSRLDAARPTDFTNPNGTSLFPFPADLPFSPGTRRNARRLVKACSAAISAELGPALTTAGLDTAVAGAGRTRDAIELAKDVAEAVYMGFADSVIYAGALVAEADELLSADSYLTKTVNRIKSEGALRQARERLETRVAAVLSREPATVTLPSATKIPARKS